MISYDFEYYKPTAIEEAISLFETLNKKGKNPLYFSGGTEIITLGRTNRLVTGAVIDIKAIKECQIKEINEDEIIFGAALSLTNIIETNNFPLLSETIAQIADHTARNKITLGGNICGDIPYKEAVLPFLITNSKAVIASKSGIEEYPLKSLFTKELQLKNEELLIQIKVNRSDAQLPFANIKKRRQWDVGYPLITISAIKKNGQLKVSFSGLCDFPFHNDEIDQSINNEQLTENERVKEVLKSIPAPILNDVHGSAEYRQFVLKNMLQDIIDSFKGAGSS